MVRTWKDADTMSLIENDTESTKPTRVENEIADVRGLVDEARESLDKLVAIFCYASDRHDEDETHAFNAHAASVASCLDGIRNDVEKVAAVAIDAGLAGKVQS
jgi:hypothetical protein